jgi:hypothetical protein
MCKKPATIFNRLPAGFNCNYGALRATAPLSTKQEVGSSNLIELNPSAIFLRQKQVPVIDAVVNAVGDMKE